VWDGFISLRGKPVGENLRLTVGYAGDLPKWIRVPAFTSSSKLRVI
jgi:hypothetical protein